MEEAEANFAKLMKTKNSNRKCIIVSNRLPVNYNPKTEKFVQSTGGLVSALAHTRIKDEQLWVGYAENPESLKSYKNLVPVGIEPQLYDDYYNGMSNDVLWPLFHYETSYVDFKKTYWEAYEKVNRLFAEKILSIAGPNDIIWIHDYHLMLLPQYLRKEKAGLKIGFFLHIPFPSSEIFRSLSMRRQLLEGVLDANLIGFQDYDYLRHFSSAVYNIMGLESDLHLIENGKYNTNLGVFPVSINTDKFEKKKKTNDLKAHLAEYELKQKKIILGIDRLDYIKGLDLKFSAFRELLKRYPEWQGKVHFYQLAVPSRIHVEDYIITKNEVERMVGQINGEFGKPGYAPIHYMFSSLPFDKLMALYQASDVLYVSSKRDGMNLVSMEYIISQKESDPGVLLLSEFAGAASILSHSLQVNPWDFSDTADAMHRALSMEQSERKRRNSFMVEYLRRYDSSAWANSFLSRLSEVNHISRVNSAQKIDVKKDGFANVPAALKLMMKKKNIILFLDYDGTLSRIVENPEEARISDTTLKLLARLGKNPRIKGLVIVSGRDSKFIHNQVKNAYVSIASEHGARFYDRRSKKWISLGGSRPKWKSSVQSIVEDYVRCVPGSLMEVKEYGVSWHYRKSPLQFGEYQARKLFNDLETTLIHSSASVLWGNKVIEARSLEANKGHFATWYMSSYERTEMSHNTYVVAVGDDKTDEDMFARVMEAGTAIRVGKSATIAPYYLDKQEDVLSLLNTIDKILQ